MLSAPPQPGALQPPPVLWGAPLQASSAPPGSLRPLSMPEQAQWQAASAPPALDEAPLPPVLGGLRPLPVFEDAPLPAGSGLPSLDELIGGLPDDWMDDSISDAVDESSDGEQPPLVSLQPSPMVKDAQAPLPGSRQPLLSPPRALPLQASSQQPQPLPAVMGAQPLRPGSQQPAPAPASVLTSPPGSLAACSQPHATQLTLPQRSFLPPQPEAASQLARSGWQSAVVPGAVVLWLPGCHWPPPLSPGGSQPASLPSAARPSQSPRGSLRALLPPPAPDSPAPESANGAQPAPPPSAAEPSPQRSLQPSPAPEPAPEAADSAQPEPAPAPSVAQPSPQRNLQPAPAPGPAPEAPNGAQPAPALSAAQPSPPSSLRPPPVAEPRTSEPAPEAPSGVAPAAPTLRVVREEGARGSRCQLSDGRVCEVVGTRRGGAGRDVDTLADRGSLTPGWSALILRGSGL